MRVQINAPNLLSAQFKADPFPFYARMRDEQPVFQANIGRQRAWLVTRYDDVLAALKDPRLLKNRRSVLSPEQMRKQPWLPAFARALERNMLDLDEPDHTRLRVLVHKAFTPRIVEHMREFTNETAHRLLDAVQGRAEFDLVRDFALPLPLAVIVEMLGVPAADRERFHRWS